MAWKPILTAVALALAPMVVCAQVVATDAGRVRGSTEGGVTVFRGVPFAAAPVGPLRWRPPAPAARWKGVRPATAFAPACMQTGVSMPGETPPAISEDCLYLNIWRPAGDRSGALPVMVWIYGGGFTNGSASMPLYWGDRLAQKGVVVVTIAYRVGPLGFLAHPELSMEGQGRSGNYGLMDQVAALQWVKRNIGGFGGDPGNVTILGQSAGATSVSILMAAPAAKGLFHKAVGQSGGVFEPLQIAPRYQLAAAEKDGLAYAASVKAGSLAELRALPAADLLKGARAAAQVSHPVVDPLLLPTSPYDIFAAGRQNDVPLLVGSNADEARSLTDLRPVRAATFAADITARWGPLPPALLTAYPFKTDEEAKAARAGFERDLRFGWDAWTWARLQSKTGRGKVFAYHFDRAPPFPKGSVYEGWGAGHFTDLWYMSDHLDQEPTWVWTEADRALARAMSAYWVNFARSGDPNGPGLPPWPAYMGDAGQTLFLGETIRPGAAPNREALIVFDRTYEQLRSR